jgi:hypothetical protein
MSGTSFSTDIGARLYKGQAPDKVVYPYAVFMLVSDTPDDAFAKKGETALFQFSLFSSASGSTEVEDMYSHLKTVYDDCSLSPTGSTLIWMRRMNATLIVEDHTTLEGTQKVWHYAVDYEITTQES